MSRMPFQAILAVAAGSIDFANYSLTDSFRGIRGAGNGPYKLMADDSGKRIVTVYQFKVSLTDPRRLAGTLACIRGIQSLASSRLRL